MFKKLNLIFGWMVFAVASTVYLLTIEPTASFWDCGEFIACGNKLLVGHPPGAPMFLVVARLFAMLNPSNPAVMINAMSALASAFTILFLFWSVSHLMAKVYSGGKGGERSAYDYVVIFGSATVGALAYTFSDTFWFSAVEGEVYAMSSLFTAVVFWAMLKWESEANETFANRWIVLIAYLLGLSIGVHLLNLLAIPAMAFIYYFKKYKVSTKGLIYVSLAAVVILAAILYGIIPGTFKLASLFELAFVNGFGMGYNSGLLFFAFALFAALAYLIYWSHKKRRALLNIVSLCATVILLGYGSYALVLVRSSANPSMDQNNPDNVFNLISYLNRDQYGDRPLVHGQYFNAPVVSYADGGAQYAALDGRYEVVSRKTEYVYDKRFTTLFPRMFSSQGDHVSFFKSWNGGFSGRSVRMQGEDGKPTTEKVPTFADNIEFFFSYQLNFMYLRYLMWNFAGRQNDLQCHGEPTHGNWICGIPFIDNARLGADQSLLPDSSKDNKAHNRYYLLPLLLGFAGLCFQYSRSKKDFVVLLLLFFSTGVAIVMYLNQTPLQPRERDYAYAGSFYAFALWIGVGVAAVAEALRRAIRQPVLAGSMAFVACTLLVPTLMAKENWDDHDRSGRYLARDFAHNYLRSCRPQSVLFTYGDNDTFPLWYAQEVEGIRTDVRIMNLSYASAEWYIAQMSEAYYQSKPLPMTLTFDKVAGDRRGIVFVQERIKEPVDIKKAMDFVVSDEPSTKGYRQGASGQEPVNYFPTRTLRLETRIDSSTEELFPLDKYQLDASAEKPTPEALGLLPYIDIKLGASYVQRNSLAQLDLLANFMWKRPIVWGSTVPSSYNLGLEKYFVGEGFGNLLFPQLHPSSDGSYINADTTYEMLMNRYVYRNLNAPNVYYDENCNRMIASTRRLFTNTIFALINEDKDDKARELLDKYFEVFSTPQVSYLYDATAIVNALYYLKDYDKGNAVADTIAADAAQLLRYYGGFKNPRAVEQERSHTLSHVYQLKQLAARHQQAEKEKELDEILQMYSR
jgi:hypothetical protein